jgi:bifunctional non-homologous end joining protein LigD
VKIDKGGERQEPWILFKKCDSFARPTAEYDVVSALPDSMIAKPLRPPRRRPLAVKLSTTDTVKDFSQAVVVHLATTIPSRFVAKSGPASRKGKLFVDYLRKGHGATTAAAFSARSRPGLGVSMPASWDELGKLKSSAHWTIATAREHLSFQTTDPWAGYWKKRQSLAPAIKKFE